MDPRPPPTLDGLSPFILSKIVARMRLPRYIASLACVSKSFTRIIRSDDTVWSDCWEELTKHWFPTRTRSLKHALGGWQQLFQRLWPSAYRVAITGLNREDAFQAAVKIASLGGRLEMYDPHNVSHCVIGGSGLPTLRAMATALAANSWIVPLDWLDRSHQQGYFLIEDESVFRCSRVLARFYLGLATGDFASQIRWWQNASSLRIIL